MSFTTDFSEIKKPSGVPDVYVRKVQSSTKRRPQYTRSLFKIAPLNFNELKREIEEADKNGDFPLPFNDIQNTETVAKVPILNPRPSISSTNILQDISNSTENVNISSTRKVSTTHTETQSDQTPAKENIPVRKLPSNDSFDLGFTALSISTPAKGQENSLISSGTKYPVPVTNFDSFRTPKNVNNEYSRNNYSMPSRLSKDSMDKRPWFPSVRITAIPEAVTLPQGNKEETPDNKQDRVVSVPGLISQDEPFKKLRVKNAEYLIMNLLGKGGSSEVYHCYCLKNKQHVAIKCVSLQNATSATGYINEVKLLQKLQNCDRIVKMYDYEILEQEHKLFVVLEKGEVDLATIMKSLARQGGHIPVYILIFYWMEMLQAVKQIHSNGVIHSDLKPANFLRAEGGLKLIDFGIASSVATDMTSVIKANPEGSCNYMSPEALNNDNSANASSPSFGTAKYKVHFKSDVWSLGCILYQLVYKQPPFNHLKSLWTKLAFILNPDHTIEYPEANWVPQKILDTIKKCLQYNVKSRPSISELLEEYDNVMNNLVNNI